jgi:PIN domain
MMAKKNKERGDPVTPVRLLLDTCVWLDLAGNDANEPLLGALETLCRQHVIDIIVPRIVRDEFANNKDRVIRESGRSLAGVLKRARVAVWTHGDKRKRRNAAAVLDDIEHKLNNSPDNTAQAIARIEKIFADSISCETNDEATLRASNRALQKKAPFHNGRNNFADALILELYGQMVKNGKGRCVFVTHNVKDFSATNADQRLPHPDIAQHFSRIKSRYFIKLIDALRVLRPNQFAEAMFEHEFTMESRRASEISDAIEELKDRVWYDRHMVGRFKIQTGKTKIIAKKDFGPQHYRDSANSKLVVDEVWKGALKAAKRVEKKYGKANLGPYSKFEWGMINGKLSALRWVLGEEWDMLYT